MDLTGQSMPPVGGLGMIGLTVRRSELWMAPAGWF